MKKTVILQKKYYAFTHKNHCGILQILPSCWVGEGHAWERVGFPPDGVNAGSMVAAIVVYRLVHAQS
jgi:hypothetical protein